MKYVKKVGTSHPKGEAEMDKQAFMAIYDRICFALTEYEDAPTDEDTDGVRGRNLYFDVVHAMNDLAELIN